MSHNRITLEENISKYSNITFNIPFDILINKYDRDSEHLFFESDLQNNPFIITYDTSKDMLYVECKGKSLPSILGKIYLNSSSIKSITNNGIGNLFCNIDGLKTFNFKGSSVANAKIEGTMERKNSNLTLKNVSVGNINCKVIADKIDVNSKGTGNITLSGETSNISIEANGIGNVNAKDLKSTEVEVISKGIGEVKVSAFEIANVRVNGIGDVTVYRKPYKIDAFSNGIGRISLPDMNINKTNAYNLNNPKNISTYDYWKEIKEEENGYWSQSKVIENNYNDLKSIKKQNNKEKEFIFEKHVKNLDMDAVKRMEKKALEEDLMMQKIVDRIHNLSQGNIEPSTPTNKERLINKIKKSL